MPKLNWEIILYNLREAREQIEEIERLAAAADLDEIDFQTKMQHAYHHLNFAWNIRHASTESYSNLTDYDFNKWGQFPLDLDDFDV